jgi:c(7)-type cytochrome triheme protein
MSGTLQRLFAALAAIAVGTAIAASIPGNVQLSRVGPETAESVPTAVFPHWAHRIRFTCNVCHPAIYPMKAGETQITMDDIDARKSCGICHNGKVAFASTISTCFKCHATP